MVKVRLSCSAVRVPERTGRTVPVLEIDRVSKRYGDVVALRELSFQIRGGELFGFVGSNGAGPDRARRGTAVADRRVAAVAIVAITAVVALAGRVYAGAVLRTGSRVKLADALRPM